MAVDPDKKPEVNASLYDMLTPDQPGFVPLPTVVGAQPEGSTLYANLKDSTSWGVFAGLSASNYLEDKPLPIDQVISKIPIEHIDHADKYVGATSEADITSISTRITNEEETKNLLAAHPWKSFVSGFAAQLMDPVNLFLPGTFLFKASAREAGAITRMAGTALAASTAAGVQEGILHQAQLSRTASDRDWETN